MDEKANEPIKTYTMDDLTARTKNKEGSPGVGDRAQADGKQGHGAADGQAILAEIFHARPGEVLPGAQGYLGR